MSKQPFFMEMSAFAVDPKLHVDKKPRPDGSQSLRFKATPFTSESDSKDPDAIDTDLVRWLPLTNTSPVPVRFRATATSGEPNNEAVFAVVEEQRGRELQLDPGHNVAIGVELRRPPADDKKRWPMVPKYRLRGALSLTYSNQQSQSVDLEAWLLRPSVQLSATSLDFGTIHIDASKPLTLTLSNPSSVRSPWHVLHAKKPRKVKLVSTMDAAVLRNLHNTEFDDERDTVDDPTVFDWSALRGVVLARSQAPSLTVRFHPKKDVTYLSRFRLLVEHSDTPFIELTLRGCGSLDEAFDNDNNY
eukprot:TRINITY_DN96998_c0_g1_i1.p1 TRINITY_DN96998_c0_g1~~TRINITY_DN96998_c0_g1_i1.p1  ORF type:complete len:323 (-),score=181.49 TRINITY_DN96998_c0_g1_i1:65-970(-)